MKRSGTVLSVGFVLAENFTLSAFSLFVDHLRLAADEGDFSRPIQCRWSVMGNRSGTVRASCGVAIACERDFPPPRSFDYIVVVGGLLHRGPQVDDRAAGYLKEAAAQGVPLVGICTGSFILCRAGLMRGRQCCVSWYHHQDFLSEFPDQAAVSDRMFVIDGDRITCSGGGGAADLAAHLIEQRLGRALAQKSRHVLLLDRARAGSAAQPHPPVQASADDERVRRALLLMEQNLAEPLAIARIAATLEISPRQLERLFQADLGRRPAAIYRLLRLRYAQWLLDNTARSVTDIACEAGFSDGAHLARQFKRAHGLSPSEMRDASPARPGSARAAVSHRIFGAAE